MSSFESPDGDSYGGDFTDDELDALIAHFEQDDPIARLHEDTGTALDKIIDLEAGLRQVVGEDPTNGIIPTDEAQ